jgi:DNA polymerase
VRKPLKSDPDPVAKLLKSGRACGKVGVLGGGYGMGPDRCRDYAEDFGLTLTFDEATNVINTYRKTYPNIVKFWKDIYDAFKWTHKTNRESTVGALRLYADITPESEDVVIVLPSGRELRYANVAEQMGDRGPELVCYSQRSGKWSKIYGGYLTENIVQALCRDFLAEAVLILEAEGIRIPLTVHDEIVAVARDEVADRVLARIIEVMSITPDWAAGCPLGAEGKVVDFYGK